MELIINYINLRNIKKWLLALLGALLCFRSTVSWESIGWGAALGYGIWIALAYLFTGYNKIDNQENVHNHQHFHSGNFGNFSD